VARACHSARSSTDASPVFEVDDTGLKRKATNRSASGYGSGRNSTASPMVMMAIFAPMPTARVSTAMVANPRCLRSIRRANRVSCQIPFSMASECRSAPRRSSTRHESPERNNDELECKKATRASPARDQATVSTRIARKHPNFGAPLAQCLRHQEPVPRVPPMITTGGISVVGIRERSSTSRRQAFRREHTAILSRVASPVACGTTHHSQSRASSSTIPN